MPIAKTNPATQTAARTIGNPSLDATLWVWGIEPVGAAVGAADPIAGLSTTATDVTCTLDVDSKCCPVYAFPELEP